MTLFGCAEADPGLVTGGALGQAERVPSVAQLEARTFDGARRTEWRLPPALREVSGIAVVGGRVFSHNDEEAVIYELDVDTGDYAPFLRLKSKAGGTVLDDFEGITFLGDDLFLVTSEGLLFRAPGVLSGEVAESEAFEVFATGLADVCEVEGLDTLNTVELVIACKNVYAEDVQRLYAWHAVDAKLRLLIELPRVDKARPSAVLALTDGYAMLSAKHALLQVFAAEGRLVRSAQLKEKRHRQAEGLGWLPDGRIVIADEGGKKGGRISVYAP